MFEKIVGKKIKKEDVKAFFYTLSSSAYPAKCETYVFYTQKDEYKFECNKKEGKHFPLLDGDVVFSTEKTVSDVVWNTLFECLQGGKVTKRKAHLETGVLLSLYLYWEGDRDKWQEFSFETLGKKLEFERLCQMLADDKENNMCLKNMSVKNQPIESFDNIVIRVSGMRGACEYHLVRDEDKARIEFYLVKYGRSVKEDRLELDESKTVELSAALAKLEEVGIMAWDGFSGEHPRDLLDGEMFRLDGVVNGREIHADGSANFPKNYHVFMRWMNDILRESN